MDKFNLQFATQRLREEEDSELKNWIDKISNDGGKTWNQKIIGNDGIIWKQEKVFKDKDNNITGYNYVPYYKGYNISTGGFNFKSIKVFAEIIKDYIVSNQLYNKLKFEPEKPLDEESVTSDGAGMTPSTVNNFVTQDWYTTKKTPKKEGANIPKDFTDAPSIPNRPSKGGFIYKKIFEELSKALKEEVSVGDFNHYRSALNDAYQELGRDGDMEGRKAVADADKSLKDAEAAEKAINNSKITPGNKATYLKAINGIKRYLSQSNQKNESLNKGIKEEYTETNLPTIIDDIRSHIETSSALNTEFKQFALSLLGSIDSNVENEDWIEALSDFEDLNDSIKQVNRMEWEEVYNEMFEKAIRRVEPLAIEMEDDFYDDDEPVSDYGKYRQDPDYYEKDYQEKDTGDYFQRRSLDESYSKFKNQTKTRSNPEQFHQAIKAVKKKVLEINKMYEYVSRLKEELSEGGNALEYKMHTEKALHKIKEMVSELNKKIKRFK